MESRPGYVWSGTEWVRIGGPVIQSPIYYQSSAPSTPSTGDIWVESDVDVPTIASSSYYRWRKTMTGGETSLSGTDDSSLTLAYSPNYEMVFLNGVMLTRGIDYTATTGSTVTGLTAFVANDIVEVMSPLAFNINDTYNQSYINSNFSILNKPAFRLYQSSAQSVLAGVSVPTATNTNLLFNAEDLDTHNGHSLVTNTSRYTSQYDGWYFVTGTVQFVYNATGNRLITISKNGSTVNQNGRSSSSATNTLGLSVSTMVYLSVGDYIEVNVYQASGVSLDTLTANPSIFEGFWVRP